MAAVTMDDGKQARPVARTDKRWLTDVSELDVVVVVFAAAAVEGSKERKRPAFPFLCRSRVDRTDFAQIGVAETCYLAGARGCCPYHKAMLTS